MKYLQDFYTFIDKHGDKRVAAWPLMQSPFPTVLICSTFLYLSKVMGPKWMQTRKPFHLMQWIRAYNMFQVLFNSWLVYEFLVSGWSEYSFKCQPIDRSGFGKPLRMAKASWWFLISKMIDFIDTLFFILRKKFDHVSILHTIHHATMPMSSKFQFSFLYPN